MNVDTVTTRRQLREFIDLPLRLHPQDQYVPTLAARITSWWRGSSPHPEPIELVLVRGDAGTIVARSTLHTDARFDEKLDTRALLFGATEFADATAADVLFAHLNAVAAERGCTELIGPVSLLPNQAGGVITAGFENRGFVDSAWNPASVPGVYEQVGFTRWNESDTWVVEVDPGFADAPGAAEWTRAGVTLEYGAKREMRALIPELLELLNASFDSLPYYTPISPDEMAAATDGLAWLLDEKLLLLARDAQGAAAAFVLVVPDISRFVQSTGGRMGLPQQLRLLATRGTYRDEAILIIQGTRPELQGRGILTLLSRQLQTNLADGGYRRLRSTYVGRENAASARQFARFGGTPLHGYTFYRRQVAALSPANERSTHGR